MPTLVQSRMAGWDCILVDAGVPRHCDYYRHDQSRNLTNKESPDGLHE